MMNSIISTTLILVTILFSATCMAENDTKPWYAGVSVGVMNNKDTVNDKGAMYGLLGGYHLTEWLSVEAEISKHNTVKKRFEDSYSNLYVDFTQSNEFAFVGLRATKPLGRIFGFTARLGAGYTRYKSDFEQETLVNISSAVGMSWRIKNYKITYEIQQIKYPEANSQEDNYLGANLSLRYNF
ncbi:outer membrane beta-barrel protein [Paraglaciecola sp.]|uniref:outer membrane beta-barrel protein n=2 Tax=Paraglaciecola sp. TaxID=1920173 RepID=UPI003299356C